MVKKIDEKIQETKEKSTYRSPSTSSGSSLRSDKYFYAVGGRKEATATIHLYTRGGGKITINNRDYRQYFSDFEFQKIVEAPLRLVGEWGRIDISVRVRGGGRRGQAEAIRHGIAQALDKYNTDYHAVLKKEGFFTRDRRVKERKKPGLKRARRAPQWQKR